LGLKRNSVRVVNWELGVFEADFYIEKTLRSYAPFFVNRCTFDAFTCLVNLERSHMRLVAIFGESTGQIEHSLFWRRRFLLSTRGLSPRTWFEFSLNRTKAAAKFSAEALGETVSPHGTSAHIFRRFYALLFMYRFEHSSLLHLRHQLGHLNLESTRIYVTDESVTALEARIPTALRRGADQVRSTVDAELKAIELELANVAGEKLDDTLRAIISGSARSGGFPRLILKLEARMMADLEFGALDHDARLERLGSRIKSRGHHVRPMPHGDCYAGTSPAHSAHCSGSGKGPVPSNAEPITCARCPYSLTTVGHLAGMKEDLNLLETELEQTTPASLIYAQKDSELRNLRAATALHQARLVSA
jgi:hypothetical protein